MKVAITGAFGLVGSHLYNEIQRMYPDAVIAAFKCTEFPDTAWKAEVIVHCAGYGQPQMFSKDKIKTIEINTTDTIRLFSHLEEGGKFLFVSSSEVYSGAPSPHKETDIGTTTPQHPRACYIEGKRCGEAICMAYKEQGYDVKIARLALAYGPGTKKGDTRVLNQFIEQALTTGEIRMKDAGEAVRTYGYIDQVVEQLLFVLFKGKDCVYNVGGESTISVFELAIRISLLTGAKVIQGNQSLEGSPDSVKLNLSKIKDESGIEFLPVDLSYGLMKTIEYQKELYAIK